MTNERPPEGGSPDGAPPDIAAPPNTASAGEGASTAANAAAPVRRRVDLPFLFKPLDDSAPGPLVVRVFQKGFAVIWAFAWLSLGSQVLGLIGSRGLLPFAEALAVVPQGQSIRFADFPSLFLYWPGDGALRLGIVAGLLFAAAIFLDIWPRLFLLLSTLLYLSYAVACRAFLGFQWDNLLLEAGFVSLFLSTRAPSRLGPLLVRLLLFKLYFESGLAKWQSPLGDWRDGSAMTFYYETAPLPTPLAFFAHHASPAWHHFESWATLALELVGPFCLFGPRRARLVVFCFFTAFQGVDFLTANYGFFCLLAAWLGLLLLGERDIAWQIEACRSAARRLARGWRMVSERFRRPEGRPRHAYARRLLRWRDRARNLTSTVVVLPRRPTQIVSFVVAAIWTALSFAEAWPLFAGEQANSGVVHRLVAYVDPLLTRTQPFRLTNAYHLFATVTRERWEPTLEVDEAGDGRFRELAFHHKPGPLDRRPPFVAPHQPRVDFQLWFLGLGNRRREPAYLDRLLGALCDAPDDVAWLFTSPLPRHPASVRLTYWSTHFASGPWPGPWWIRDKARPGPSLRCQPEGKP